MEVPLSDESRASTTASRSAGGNAGWLSAERSWDVPLDLIVTEREVLRPTRGHFGRDGSET